jgi:SAM-dependent methyltransferase
MTETEKNGIPNEFTSDYYDIDYYASEKGKQYRRQDGSTESWGYKNPSGHWEGCGPIIGAWKSIFNPMNLLDVGCGRGQFVAAARRAGIDAYGFDYSRWAIGNKYINCDASWIGCHDATVKWLYGDRSFDLVIVLDLMEHLYNDGDIDKVIDELYRVGRRWIFLQIAGCGEEGFKGYILKRGEKIPVELGGMVVAGHVTVQSRQFWIDKLLRYGNGNERKGWKLRDDMVVEFTKRIDPAIIDNWIKNIIIVLERI